MPNKLKTIIFKSENSKIINVSGEKPFENSNNSTGQCGFQVTLSNQHKIYDRDES